MGSLYSLDINPLLDVVVNIISHSIGCLFMLLNSSFVVQKLFCLMKSHLSIFASSFGVISKKKKKKKKSQCPNQYQDDFPPMFSSSNFVISGPTFKALIDFEFIFVYGVRYGSYFIPLHVEIQFSQCHLLKRCLFPVVFSWHSC